MSLEKGGRADKLGNQYENRYLATLFLYTIRGRFRSVEVEPLGVEGVEFQAVEIEGKTVYYQCKASNGDFDHWRICDLSKHRILLRAAELLKTDGEMEYHFISPLSYGELSELCDRTRRCKSAQELINYQLTNDKLKKAFRDCAQQLSLNTDDTREAEQLRFLLSHCYFDRVASDQNAVTDLEEHISATLTGKASGARILLEQMANDDGRFGVPITSYDILSYLERHGVHLRQLATQEKDLPRVMELNRQYQDGFAPIAHMLFHRKETDELFQQIQQGHSVLLCGKAGMGKSGCLQELVAKLNEEGVLYLSLRLDKHIPERFADAYGEALGLPHSPVHVLAALAAGNPCVLILDQLDSLRWTSRHSGTALDVCKEMIVQANALNELEDVHITLVLVSRTIDYETDSGLQSLVELKSDKQPSAHWKRINVDMLSEQIVSDIIGDVWGSLPARLQKMLRIPSSLYVWTKLEPANRSNGITSVYQLVGQWWKQILSGCENTGLAGADVVACRNKLIRSMEARGVLSLPIALFSDEQTIIDVLASNGLILCQGCSLAFSHQSFFDYFTVSNMLNGLYCEGKSLLDFLGTPDDQLPALRYRLLMALQVLLDSDSSLFLQESKKILASDHVRFYFQCTVFEVVGQCVNPSDNLLQLTELYLLQEKWYNNVWNTVYLGHPAFIYHWGSNAQHAWNSQDGLQLLSSIVAQEPEYVADALRSIVCGDEEQNYKAFHTLPHSADEAQCLFALRMELLKTHPAFWHEFWGFSLLFEHKSLRVIPLLILMLQQKDAYSAGKPYFPDKKKLADYAAHNAEKIVCDLYPALSRATKELIPPISHFGDAYELWGNRKYNDTNARKIVLLVRYAFQHFAASSPDSFLAMLKEQGQSSVVDHELMLCGMLSLPVDYADCVLSWFISDFEHRIFDYTNNPYDYLSSTKAILKRFSPHCSSDIFRALETNIFQWPDSVKRMRDIYNRRLERRRNGFFAVWGYWGHLQKELLPCLCQERLSSSAKDLLRTLDRNPGINGPHYHCGFMPGKAGAVSSPVDEHRGQLSDKAWLKIIRTPPDKMKERNWKSKNGHLFESSHRAFSDTFHRQAQEEPERFARLSLQFPEKTYHGYIYPILSALAKTEKGRVDHDLTCTILRRFGNSPNIDVANDWARVLRQRADEDWPEDILCLLEKLATTHLLPKPGKPIFTSSSDPDNKDPHSLLQQAINSPRGCGAEAIAALLLAHPDLGERFQLTIQSLCHDPDDSVRFVASSCAAAYYNIEPTFAFEMFDTLLEQDVRILAAPEVWQLIARGYQERPDYYRAKLIAACTQDHDELAKTALQDVAALATYYADDSAYEFLLSKTFPCEQAVVLARQVTSSFSNETAHERSTQILAHLIDTTDGDLFPGLASLFFDHHIYVERDSSFLVHLMESKQSPRLMHEFIEYLKEYNGNLCVFAEIIAAASRGIGHNASEHSGYIPVSDLISCVVRLLGQNIDNPTIRKICLDIWDNLFQSDISTANQLSNLVEEHSISHMA